MKLEVRKEFKKFCDGVDTIKIIRSMRFNNDVLFIVNLKPGYGISYLGKDWFDYYIVKPENFEETLKYIYKVVI